MGDGGCGRFPEKRDDIYCVIEDQHCLNFDEKGLCLREMEGLATV